MEHLGWVKWGWLIFGFVKIIKTRLGAIYRTEKWGKRERMGICGKIIVRSAYLGRGKVALIYNEDNVNWIQGHVAETHFSWNKIIERKRFLRNTPCPSSKVINIYRSPPPVYTKQNRQLQRLLPLFPVTALEESINNPTLTVGNIWLFPSQADEWKIFRRRLIKHLGADWWRILILLIHISMDPRMTWSLHPQTLNSHVNGWDALMQFP